MQRVLALVSNNLLSSVYILFLLALIGSELLLIYLVSPQLAKSSFLDSTQVGFLIPSVMNGFVSWTVYRALQAERQRVAKRKNFTIRPILPTDEPFLWKMLYQAFDIPDRGSPDAQSIAAEMNRYLKDWGRPDDYGVIAVDQRNQQPIAAAWFRLLTGDKKGCAYVNDRTPELVFSVLPEYQIWEIQMSLLKHVFTTVKDRFSSISTRAAPKSLVWRLSKLPKIEVARTRLTVELIAETPRSRLVVFHISS